MDTALNHKEKREIRYSADNVQQRNISMIENLTAHCHQITVLPSCDPFGVFHQNNRETQNSVKDKTYNNEMRIPLLTINLFTYRRTNFWQNTFTLRKRPLIYESYQRILFEMINIQEKHMIWISSLGSVKRVSI